MKAIVCEAWGPPSSLQLRDVPSPVPGPKQVLVRTRVAAVNFPDALIVAGKYQFKPEFPFSPGGELSGEIIAIGNEVKRLAIGDKVVGLTPYGAYAQEVLVDAAHIVPLPRDITDADLELAGSFVLTYGTSLHALKDRAQAQAGETLLVLGAGGGVGLAAVEIGKLLGMRVIAAASSEEKLNAARERGADETINYSSDDLRERIKALTEGRGVDQHFLRIGAIGRDAHYLVAYRKVLDLVADGDDLSRQFTTGRKGKFRFELIFSGNDQGVGKIHGCYECAHQYLLGPRSG